MPEFMGLYTTDMRSPTAGYFVLQVGMCQMIMTGPYCLIILVVRRLLVANLKKQDTVIGKVPIPGQPMKLALRHYLVVPGTGETEALMLTELMVIGTPLLNMIQMDLISKP